MATHRVVMTVARRLFALGACLLAAACVSTTDRGTVGVDRSQFVFNVGSDEVTEAAKGWYADTINRARSEGRLNQDEYKLSRLRAIAGRLTPHTSVFRPDAVSWDWEVNLISSSEVNAWCMAGGKIAFYTGILDSLQLDDDEAAAIMGHEIAHALREHTRERMGHRNAADLITRVARVSGKFSTGRIDTAISGYQTFGATFFSRGQESEADRMGIELMARGGYDPKAAPRVWEKMQEVSGGPGGLIGTLRAFASTHPANEDRKTTLEGLVDTVMPLYTTARQSGSTAP